jgi:predicted DNA-binding transcriptional regulator AlpA
MTTRTQVERGFADAGAGITAWGGSQIIFGERMARWIGDGDQDIWCRKRYRLNDFCRIYSISRSSVYKLINRRELETKVIAGRRLVPVEAAEKLFRQTEIEAFKAWWPIHNPEIPLSALTIVTDSMPPKDDEPEPPCGWGETRAKWPLP